MTDKIFTVDKYIEKRFWDGKFPHIRNRRVRVAWIAAYVGLWGISRTATEIGLSEEQVAA